MEWIPVENGEMIKKTSICGVGKVKAVKVTSGKGQSLVEKTVYNFTVRIGTGGMVLKSSDYLEEAGAELERKHLME